MKVVVLGCGAVGSVITKFLTLEKNIKQVVCADNNLKRAKNFVNFSSNKLSFAKVNANSKNDIVSITKDADLIINSSLPRFNDNILEAALQIGANYQDLCSYLDSSNAPTQLAFHNKLERAKLVGLINTGLSPGLTNLLAKIASLDFDRVNSIRIRTLQQQYASQPIFALSPEIILEEAKEPALIYRNKKFEYIEPFSEVEEYPFPKPSGKKFVFSVYGDEVSTLPRYIATDSVDFKASGNDIESAKALYDLGLLQKEAIPIGKESFIPLDFISKGLPDVPTPQEMLKLVEDGIFKDSEVILAVEISGEKHGKKILVQNTVKFPSIKEMHRVCPGSTYISFPTGLSAFCFSKIIPKIKEEGVFPPEALNVDLLQEVISEMASNGIVFHKKISNV